MFIRMYIIHDDDNIRKLNKVAYLLGSMPVAENAVMAFDMISFTTRFKFRDR